MKYINLLDGLLPLPLFITNICVELLKPILGVKFMVEFNLCKKPVL